MQYFMLEYQFVMQTELSPRFLLELKLERAQINLH